MSELQKYFALEIAYNGRAIQTSVYVYVAEEVDAARAVDKATIAELQERLSQTESLLARSEDHIRWLLPMAKGWAAANPVGANQQICNDAQGHLRAHALVVGAEGVEPSTSVESGRRSTDELSTLVDLDDGDFCETFGREARERVTNVSPNSNKP